LSGVDKTEIRAHLTPVERPSGRTLNVLEFFIDHLTQAGEECYIFAHYGSIIGGKTAKKDGENEILLNSY
jgi:putative aminopeptidase FrvX